METDSAVIAAYEAALPADARVERKKMFGTPCAFVNRQMFFGIFENTLVARVGPARVGALTNDGRMRVFTPTPDRPWHDYVQTDPGADASTLSGLAAEALVWSAKLPAKTKLSREQKKARKKS